MVEIGESPLLCHLMNIYSAYGFNEFIIALGYKGDVIKDYFLSGNTQIRKKVAPEWKIDLVDTGLHTQTGGRLKRLRESIGHETFMMTYGDGLADIDIPALLDFHRTHNKLATVTAVHPLARFGCLKFNGDQVSCFVEKSQTQEDWVSGGFFVLEPEIFSYIEGDDSVWELKPLQNLVRDGQLYSYRHKGFWQPMDTLSEQKQLEDLWQSGNAPWIMNLRLDPDSTLQDSYPAHHLVKTGFISTCQICKSTRLHTILDLGHQPLCDSLLNKNRLNEEEKTYPLRMVWCENCTGSQIDYCVDGKEVYHPDYPYRSGITKELAEYQLNISHSLIEKYGLKQDDLVIDIGSNDGTLLRGFQQEGMRVLGIEPTNIAGIAQKEGIPTIQAFFDISTAKKIKNEYGLASVMTSTNMFAHMQTIGEVIQGVHHLLKEDGVFVTETHYLLDVIQGGQFDTVYHEHLRTYSLASLIKLFEPYDFTVTDAQRGSRYGGNIRVHVSKGKNRQVAPAVGQLLQLEKEAKLDQLETYTQFAQRVQKARLEFLDFLIQTKKAGKHIVGNSCPGRCSTLLNYYGITKELIPYLAEQPTSLKLGMYLPGKHIPIVNNQILIDEQPDYVVLMAWHYAKPIMQQLKVRGLRSDFVIPLPDFKIIKNSEVTLI